MREKKYLSNNKSVMKEWNYKKNKDINPNNLTQGSGKKVWWICAHGHEWQDTIYSKIKFKKPCPYCSGKKVLVGYNDLATTNPELLKEWDYDKNENIRPEDITKKSWKEAWWICDKGHSYKSSIVIKLKPNRGCPYCSNQKILKGYNDLATTNPRIASEWNYEKNGVLKPFDVVQGSNKKVWWICERGHEWQTKVVNRTTKGSRCPKCCSNGTSFPEQSIFFYLKSLFKDVQHRYKVNDKYEIDIYIPSLKLGIEYDGLYYHKNKDNIEKQKNEYLKNNGLLLIRIKETDKILQDTPDIIYCHYDYNYLYIEDVIQKLLHIINQNYKKNLKIKCDILGDRIKIEEQFLLLEKENSIVEKFPKIASEWNYEKNGKIKPEYVSQMSNSKYWWKCSLGHDFYASVSSRTNLNSGCPYCSNQKVLKGFNDLKSLKPNIVKEWDYDKNKNITPEEVTPNSTKKVWWKCNSNHSWYTSVHNRLKDGGRGCPYCSNKKVLVGYNDLTTTNPQLASEWNYEKNGDLKPINVTKSSNKKVWWKCKNGHEWKTGINNRTNGNTGCPYCSNQKILIGYNDLATTNPQLASEWNYEKNGDLKPTDVIQGSSKKVWWKCNNKHEWEASISKRANGRNCPYCSNRKLLVGYNDLATTNPQLASEWNYEKNGNLKPCDIIGGKRKVWWKCKEGHEWLDTVDHRKHGRNCGKCSKNVQ